MGKIFDYDGVPVLHTTSGDLKGYFYDGVYIYKGIPYAYADRFQRNGVCAAPEHGKVVAAVAKYVCIFFLQLKLFQRIVHSCSFAAAVRNEFELVFIIITAL